MKIRIRMPDGRTERVECLGSETVETVMQKLREAVEGAGNGSLPSGSFLSLNKKDVLGADRLLSDCGVCGGDLLYCLSAAQTTSSSSSSSSSSSLSSSSSPAVVRGEGEAGLRPARNLFGLPTAAPTSSSERIHEDTRGRRWTEEVQVTSRSQGRPGEVAVRSQQGTAEEERLKRLKAIEMRSSRQIERKSSEEMKVDSMQLDSATSRTRVGEVGAASKEEELALCVFAVLTAIGFGDGNLREGWRGKSSTFSFSFPAERAGFPCELAVKCLRMRDEFIVHAAVGDGSNPISPRSNWKGQEIKSGPGLR
ncbi:hypothetical protein GUITHDRAFT_137798 [Guillardia theta CCMP2712]|uniref:Ubiquitin-like domain-containing protein n=1 Tax=Guillardia theta (strain CCMP2712) TaxID=905079 RepID=L1JGJ4_GUITC|nr:hypothetical protein GUITHDRAFT_137798 [Guillardia theta CCMP2712]EKX47215.1 hypothetical protein GUITHDRAFT_137798 [Guillardia theta CCMP2712]|eukprot:XP_005834195.1 hypothetical protein GUITHDRAFT_137798 [Guillardia theta CCMP2712]